MCVYVAHILEVSCGEVCGGAGQVHPYWPAHLHYATVANLAVGATAPGIHITILGHGNAVCVSTICLYDMLGREEERVCCVIHR